MQISVKKPNFKTDFKASIAKAVAKELHSKIDQAEDHLFISIYSQDRPVGRFTFEKEEDCLSLKKFQVIEKDYPSFEFCISEVVKYSKRKKIKYITW